MHPKIALELIKYFYSKTHEVLALKLPAGFEMLAKMGVH